MYMSENYMGKHSLSELLPGFSLLVALGVAVVFVFWGKSTINIYFSCNWNEKHFCGQGFKLGLFVWLFCFGYRGFIEVTGISKGLYLHMKIRIRVILRWIWVSSS